MKILNLFTVYFLMLLLIQGFILIVLDSISFENAGMSNASRKARVIGKVIIILGIVLYVLRWSILG
ncbi:hypothetical protein IRP63_01410 [Clostridium botulinum]|uniref:Uncharacterized protein n=1 Tax=Clostridium botulinum C/D str. DC5 TaxID=1443128 RepID=A0A0A0IEM3_CLOBO|nr:CLC_0170 family protein [Clostridium botulinum]KEI00335.1 hypothetical protein Z952_01550 [Clostridium botulinum C/D str. BKT75002]KEI08956.1 hypothetical protein Z954_00380 [Clostridium botulinum C/D str. BKT2873]KGM93868.1 hypothetical protein Z956_10125 [Clostridium botulinum D str. CCUG 7971]KGM99427.1 hypothetical protein Z955_07655 [Clostridium botulinum C/D str. DC5]KOC51208.1 hypothetical protein ADU88_00605 [Clostridium botulinum]